MNGIAEQAMKKVIGDLTFERVIRLASNHNPRYRAFRTALKQAYAMCARQYYPKWASFLLDEEFQAHGASRLRAGYLKGGACFRPLELAGFWADQIGWLSEEVKQRHIAELAPVAARFLSCLEAELCASPEFQPRFGSSATPAQNMPATRPVVWEYRSAETLGAPGSR